MNIPLFSLGVVVKTAASVVALYGGFFAFIGTAVAVSLVLYKDLELSVAGWIGAGAGAAVFTAALKYIWF